MKRSRTYTQEEDKKNINDINPKFLQDCENKFYDDPINVISRNSVVSIGSMLSTMNSNRINHIDHIFMNTIKKKHLKATNQGRSGRCWMFSGLNMFRHAVIKALNLDNFEFSETYLFFFDKLERANRYLRWFINHPEAESESQAFKFMVEEYTGDGGWWNMFSNIVIKYGLVPKSAMKETFQSEDSEDMNQILNDRLQSCANYIINNKKLTKEEVEKIRIDTMEQIYNTLVKFLGEPPKTFRWSYTNDDDDSTIISELDPISFRNMIIPGVDMKDFVVLTHLPGRLEEKKTYEVKYTSNVFEGDNFKFLNMSIKELSKYAQKSIISGFPVWFAADVSKDFNPYHSVLDDKLNDSETVFGSNHEFSKGDKIKFRNLSANHAMSLIGLNIGSDNKPESWQVENSWGYYDNETPGQDGFLYMSDSWFQKNVMQIVVHKNLLTRSTKKLFNKEPIQLDPWDCVAPALKVKAVDAPIALDRIKKRNRHRF
jgi:bleomycin hydrolase